METLGRLSRSYPPTQPKGQPMAKTKELPAVEITRVEGKNATLLSIPKATAYAYRRRTFKRGFKQGVRQAAAALLGCAVKDVQHSERQGVYFCRESKAVHPQDLGEPAEPRKRYRRRAW